MRQENKQGIRSITMMPKAVCFCPLGDDWYTNEFEITFGVSGYYPDYCDVEKYLNENIRGRELIIEEAVSMMYEYVMEECEPVWLEVVSRVNDVTSHSPVIVRKTSPRY